MIYRLLRAFVLLLVSAATVFVSAQTPGFNVVQPQGSDARLTLQQNFELGTEGAEQICFIAVRRQPARTDEASR